MWKSNDILNLTDTQYFTYAMAVILSINAIVYCALICLAHCLYGTLLTTVFIHSFRIFL